MQRSIRSFFIGLPFAAITSMFALAGCGGASSGGSRDAGAQDVGLALPLDAPADQRGTDSDAVVSRQEQADVPLDVRVGMDTNALDAPSTGGIDGAAPGDGAAGDLGSKDVNTPLDIPTGMDTKVLDAPEADSSVGTGGIIGTGGAPTGGSRSTGGTGGTAGIGGATTGGSLAQGGNAGSSTGGTGGATALPNWTTVGQATVEGAEYIRIDTDNSIPYIAYFDLRKSRSLRVRKLVGQSWDLVGTAGFSEPLGTGLGFSKDCIALTVSGGKPYAAVCKTGIVSAIYADTFRYEEGAGWTNLKFPTSVDWKISGMKLTKGSGGAILALNNNWNALSVYAYSNAWSQVGATIATGGSDFNAPAIAMNATTPYLAYREKDWNKDYKAQIRTLSGDWTYVVEQDYATQRALQNFGTDIGLHMGVPFVMLVQGTSSFSEDHATSVVRLENNAWKEVGPAGSGDGKQMLLKDGVPILLGDGTAGCPMVSTLVENHWVPVGVQASLAAGIGACSSYHAALAADGTLYVAMTDSKNYNMVTVRSIKL
jgi:hypothetical protein